MNFAKLEERFPKTQLHHQITKSGISKLVKDSCSSTRLEVANFQHQSTLYPIVLGN